VNSEPIQTKGVARYREGGGRDLFLKANVTARVRARGNLTVITAGGEEVGGADPPSQRAAEIARTNVSVAKVLRMLGRRPLTVAKLYSIVEAVEGACNSSVDKLGWVSTVKRRRFKHTADSESVLGDEARHGFENTEPPKNPMSEKEAVDLVRHVVDQWLTVLCEETDSEIADSQNDFEG
jgi:hypothetical protein